MEELYSMFSIQYMYSIYLHKLCFEKEKEGEILF